MPVALPVSDRTDVDVVRDVLAGAHADFEILVRRHNQRLFRAARSVSKSDQDAEDVLQQTWLNVFKNLASFRGDAAFTTWATRIAVHEAIAHARKRPIIAEVKDNMSTGEQPDDVVDRAQLGKILEQCLEQLPQGNREVMVLRDVLELDTAETAACLGLSEEAVRVRLHRARATIAAQLAEQMTAESRLLYSFDGARCDRITSAVMGSIMASR